MMRNDGETPAGIDDITHPHHSGSPHPSVGGGEERSLKISTNVPSGLRIPCPLNMEQSGTGRAQKRHHANGANSHHNQGTEETQVHLMCRETTVRLLREGEREREREGGREGGREREREGERGRERGREGEREGERVREGEKGRERERGRERGGEG